MQKKYFYILILLVFQVEKSDAKDIFQSIYELKFNIPQNNNKEYTALIIMQSNGDNIVRINFVQANNKSNCSYNLPLVFNKIEFTNMAVKLKPELIYGSEKSNCFPIYFNSFSKTHFDKNNKKVSIYFNGNLISLAITTIKYLRRAELTQNYTENYFKKNEQFYTSLLANNFQNNLSRKSIPWMYYVNVGATLDDTIGSGCKKDLTNIETIFKQIAFELDMPMIETSIVDEKMSKQNVLDALTRLSPQKDDIVFFYYTGHGFSYSNDSISKYPQLDLRSFPVSPKIEVLNNSTKNIEEIMGIIKTKGARFNLVISDCCNASITYPRPLKSKLHFTRAPFTKPANRKILENLFLNQKKSLLITAANKGEYAITDESFGSIFTFNLVNFLTKNIWGDNNNEMITWQQIVVYTKEETLKMSKGYDIGGGKAGFQKPISNITD
ncbi:MAG: caspase family protein [Ferruginibacter sp.]|nr:caspase family protein [Ferruginibacter sp.]